MCGAGPDYIDILGRSHGKYFFELPATFCSLGGAGLEDHCTKLTFNKAIIASFGFLFLYISCFLAVPEEEISQETTRDHKKPLKPQKKNRTSCSVTDINLLLN